jgi:hypothetical protein
MKKTLENSVEVYFGIFGKLKPDFGHFRPMACPQSHISIELAKHTKKTINTSNAKNRVHEIFGDLFQKMHWLSFACVTWEMILDSRQDKTSLDR